MESNNNLPEVWLRGPVPAIPALLQPVAHALLQAREEITEIMHQFPAQLLWKRPADVASPAFHLQHLTGVLDRLFTYARNESLTAEQLQYLFAEGLPAQEITIQELLESFYNQVEKVLLQLSETEESCFVEKRKVGRAQLPSTVIGLFVHAAEHTTRHVGQLFVTIRILMSS